mgnify:CR=1 FL=1
MKITKQRLIEMIEEVIEEIELEEADGSGEDYSQRRKRQIKIKPKNDLPYKGDDHDIDAINKIIADKMKGKHSEPQK